MDDTFTMRAIEGPADLNDDIYRFIGGKLLLPAEQRSEILTIDVLHGDELHAVSFPQVVNANYVLMRHMARKYEFLLEALQDAGVSGQFRSNDLQGDQAIQFLIPRLVDGPHTSFTEHT